MSLTDQSYTQGVPEDLDFEVPDSPAALIHELEEREQGRFEWTWIAVGLVGLLAVLAVVASAFAIAGGGDDKAVNTAGHSAADHAAAVAAAPAAAPTKTATLADAKGIEFEKFGRVDPTLPPIPAGAVKKFEVDVYQH